MNKIRLLFLLVLTTATSIIHAQSVDQAKRFIYYTRYKSAKDALDKALASNPNDINAMYLLGQVDLSMKDTAAAKALYQRGLSSNGTAPLLLVGMGEIEL